jgi:hypothetical protein
MKPGLPGYSSFAGFMFTSHNLYTLVTTIRENFVSVFYGYLACISIPPRNEKMDIMSAL